MASNYQDPLYYTLELQLEILQQKPLGESKAVCQKEPGAKKQPREVP